jgi:hypothetical protein
VSTPPSHGALEALVAPDRARQEGRAKTELQLSIPETREEPLNEPSIRQQCQQEDRRLIPSLFVFFKQSGYRRRNLVDGFWLAQESVNAGAPSFFLAIVS